MECPKSTNTSRGRRERDPRAEGTFQGRIEELVALGTALTGDKRPPVLTIHALGGQGKTALVREAVERFLGVARRRVCDFNGNPADEGGVRRITGALSQLGSQYHSRPWRTGEGGTGTTSWRTLFVLDNAETLVQAVERQDAEAVRLARFLREDLNGTRAHLLATSHDMLGWPGEAGFDLGGLSNAEGARLFYESAPTRSNDIIQRKQKN